ncbi:AcrR family transcriptional regulator [Streptomyces aurantiacus]|uniref:TetR/AcrR family transcriptional regulator n=1 Tax=Streptomyces aurantiacus TaxID=47760 RepID=UPI00278E4F0F|nr:TetR/AcrR family transcriptional regulator [Streptomyces aurantiacus]MDQ0775819.1 AcrR family transcriptional regulator [Streptomyces aurantiacus]
MVRAADRAERPARTSVWLENRAPRGGGARGGQPSSLDRDRITEVTVRLLDAEGLAKFSMRRLAAELNVTAMSVYWYVDTKDDLLELALDAVYGELELPDLGPDSGPASGSGPGPGSDVGPGPSPASGAGPDSGSGEDWRDQLRAIASGYRALLVRHPWASPLAGTFLNIGPRSVAFSRTVQRVIRRTGLPAHRLTGAISAVFQFVYGFGTIEGHFTLRSAEAGMSPDEYFQQALSTLREAPELGEVLEESKEIMRARGGSTVEEMYERDFNFALDLVIAGIEAMVLRGER